MSKLAEEIIKREIKFRAWIKPHFEREEKEMVYFDEMFIDLEYNRLSFRCDWRKHDISYGDMQVKKPIIMQYTGLKDKNGKEIYEGDVLKLRDSDDNYRTEVVKNACYHPLEYIITPDGVRHFEVIGNIYENPNLIKTDDK